MAWAEAKPKKITVSHGLEPNQAKTLESAWLWPEKCEAKAKES